jgi:hypothetical protein
LPRAISEALRGDFPRLSHRFIFWACFRAGRLTIVCG